LCPADNKPVNGSGVDKKLALGLGLGFGIPYLLVLIIVIYRSRTSAQQNRPVGAGAGGGNRKPEPIPLSPIRSEKKGDEPETADEGPPGLENPDDEETTSPIKSDKVEASGLASPSTTSNL